MNSIKQKIFTDLNFSMMCARREIIERSEITENTSKTIYEHAKALNAFAKLNRRYDDECNKK